MQYDVVKPATSTVEDRFCYVRAPLDKRDEASQPMYLSVILEDISVIGYHVGMSC